MSDNEHFDEHAPDVEPVADWLRAQRPEVSSLELDAIKRRARARAARGNAAPARARRAFSTAAVALALAVGLGGAFAIAGDGPPVGDLLGQSNGSGASGQYKPGKGCGDPNHEHEREDECKKPPS
jgi:hypothetical protein